MGTTSDLEQNSFGKVGVRDIGRREIGDSDYKPLLKILQRKGTKKQVGATEKSVAEFYYYFLIF